MKRRRCIQILGIAAVPVMADELKASDLTITLNTRDPGRSRGSWRRGKDFQVGLGRDGYLPEGSAFVGGSSLLGEFSVNAVLSADRFEMIDNLVVQSGRTREWLKENLFRNMSSIDFDGDGRGGEYGEAFIGLEPMDSSATQPFHFGEYKGVFRWYSYAIHGTQDQSRIGKCVTGGCINVGQEPLRSLVEEVSLGDRVVIRSSEDAHQ